MTPGRETPGTSTPGGRGDKIGVWREEVTTSCELCG